MQIILYKPRGVSIESTLRGNEMPPPRIGNKLKNVVGLTAVSSLLIICTGGGGGYGATIFRGGDILYGMKTSSRFSDPQYVDASSCKDLRSSLSGHTAPRGLAFAFAQCGDIKTSLRIIQNELQIHPKSPEAWSDLSALYISKGEDPESMAAALDAADQAVLLDGSLLEARFNRAQALEALCLTSEAREAWHAYVSLDSTSPWSNLARHHLEVLRHPSMAELWAKIEGEIVAGRFNTEAIEKIVSRMPQQTRELAEGKLFTLWAQASLKGNVNEANRLLATVRSIGKALAEKNEDKLVQDVVTAIDLQSVRASLLHQGFAEYGIAANLIRRALYTDSLIHLEEAKEAFLKADNPFVLWVQFHIALCLYQESKYSEAIGVLEEIENKARINSYRSLEGRALWLMGTISVFTARPVEALSAHQGANKLFVSMSEVDNSIGTETLLAKDFEVMGDDVNAWNCRRRAIRLLTLS